MTTNWIVYTCFAVGLSCALVAGVFQAFSDFVMRGLLLAAPASGIESMQHINRTVFRSVFIATFMVLAPVTIVMAIYAWFKLAGPGQMFVIAAAIVYVVTVFLVTALGNVPMNEQLDVMAHGSPEAATYWTTYGRVWTWWNHVRTLGSVVAAACLLLAAIAFAQELG